jgi:AraC-like DNA-binding protein/quercetin dioxygenase-like cupin family protein
MKPLLERIDPVFGSSFTIREFTGLTPVSKPFWHFHPEYEIVYISKGRGKRHIANHISYYEEGDLIFLGPNLPHLGFTEGHFDDQVEVVVQMKEDFLGREFLNVPEMQDIHHLFERSRKGLIFSGQTKIWAGEQLRALIKEEPFERLIGLLKVLKTLARTEDSTLLNADGFAFEVNAQHVGRVQEVYEFVGENFQKEMTLEEIAGRVNMTEPAFCRYFKRLTGKTFTQFVNEVRIAHACRLLSDEKLSIADVSFESGFNNLSHFNKQFRLVTGASPREFRNNLRSIVE